MPTQPDAHDCRLGVLAFGDSITNGGGELQWGVALQSWALWTARALGLPYTGHAVDGARAADVVGGQMPAFERGSAAPDGRFDLGALYIGVNDVRSLDWDPERFAADHASALAFLKHRCDRTLTVTAPFSDYKGPTGILVVVQHALAGAGIPAVSLWASVPHYVATPPNPKATLALLRGVEDILDASLPLADLAGEARAWERGVDELAQQDSEVAEYVRTLEEAKDATDLPQASGDAIAREFERYLRRRGRRGEPGGI